LSDEPEKKSEMLDGSQREAEDVGAGAAAATLAAGAGAAGAASAAGAGEAGAALAAGAGAAGAALAAGAAGAAGPLNRLLPALQPDAISATPSRAAIGSRSRQCIRISPRPAYG
jgi:hypothetical protein